MDFPDSVVSFVVQTFFSESKKLSPQSFSIILALSIPNLRAKILANRVKENPQQSFPVPNATFPF